MKHLLTVTTLALVLNSTYGQVKIGGEPAAPPPSAVLELDGGSSKGLLLPRMRKMDIDAIPNPSEGLTIYATDEQAVYLRKSLSWEKQAPFTLPYYGQYEYSGSSFQVTNNNQLSGKAIRGNSSIGIGVYGESSSGRGVVGEGLSANSTGGHFINRYDGRALFCEGPMDIMDTKSDPLIRIAGADQVYRAFLQLVAPDFRIGTLASNDLGKFIIRTNGFDRVFVNPDGKIIIGSSTGTAPAGSQVLKIKGGIQATDFTVTALAAWPDYVFSKDYKLKSLEETEVFINANKHLPNMPSAALIEKDGYNIGEMQKRMMEKIEELTLHLIEANKEIQLLKKQMAVIH